MVRKSWTGIETDFQQFLADGSTIEFPTWAAASAAAGAGQIPLNRQVAVAGDSGTHVDPASGQTVPNSGRYVMTAGGLQWRSGDVISQKLDRAEFQDVIDAARVDQILVAICDENDSSTWLQARTEDGGPSDLSLQLLRKRVPALPDDTLPDPEVLVRITDGSTPPLRTWLEASTSDGGPTKFALYLLRRALGLNPENQVGYVGEGDSMMQSAMGGGSSIPDILSRMLDKPFQNFAWSGSHASEQAVRAGGYVPILMVPGGKIPADTGQVDATWDVPGTMSSTQRVFLGTVRGIACRLVYEAGVLRLNRVAAGAELQIKSPIPFIPADTFTGSYVHVYFGGRNNTPKSAAEAPIAAITGRYREVGDKFLICGVTTASDEPFGSAGYAAIEALNLTTMKRNPREYVDMQGRMIREGLSIAGISPTAADEAAIAQGLIPPSLLFDGMHFNPSGRQAAATIILNELQIRGLA